ncbi:MAG: nucleoside monophosphate kinase, partial [Rectinema sp.]|nr:nucleoside monophosphate kinase [Rectinema sp.]
AAERLGIPHISTGDMFRSAVKEGSELGVQVQSILARGGLVPDDLTIALVRERLSKSDASSGYILDGFPRTTGQAEALASFASLDAAVNFAVPDELIVFRLTGRRICTHCGAIYHVVNKPPAKEGVCDQCGGVLRTRDDDREETVKARLAAYHEETEPLIQWYAARSLLIDVDGSADAETVYRLFLDAIRSILKH